MTIVVYRDDHLSDRFRSPRRCPVVLPRISQNRWSRNRSAGYIATGLVRPRPAQRVDRVRPSLSDADGNIRSMRMMEGGWSFHTVPCPISPSPTHVGMVVGEVGAVAAVGEEGENWRMMRNVVLAGGPPSALHVEPPLSSIPPSPLVHPTQTSSAGWTTSTVAGRFH